MPENNRPQVLFSPYAAAHLGQCDCDCACVLDLPATAPVRATGDLELRKAPVYPFPLDGGWQVVFNPKGPVGVVALNAAAQGVLNSLGETTRLDCLPTCLPGLSPDTVEQAVSSLVQVGLLQPVDVTLPVRRTSSTLSAWLHISEACNLRCPYCYVPKRPRQASAGMGQRTVDRLVELGRRHGYTTVQLKYAGGEPTLNFETVWAVHEHAVRTTAQAGLKLKEVLLTNGVDVTDAMLDSIAEAGMKLMVSLDGGPAAHRQTRRRPDGRQTYDLVVSTMDRAVARGVHVDVSITLTALNLEGVPDAVAFALGRRLPFSLNFYRECQTGRKLAQAVLSHLQPDPERLIDVVRQALALVEAEPAYPLPLTGILDRARLDVPHYRPCSAGNDYLAVDPDGYISACQMLLEEPWAHLEDEDPLLAVRARGETTFRPVQDHAECSQCQWQTACSGGCPLLRDTLLNRAYCRAYQVLLPELVRLEGKRLIALNHSALN